MTTSRHPVSFEGVSQAVNQLESGKPRAVSDACHSLDRYLRANQENLRAFFTEFYLRLCQKVFGLGGNSLLGEVAFTRRECDALLNFLDPQSPFFRAMVDVDTEHLNHYQLPVRMLSAHAQSMMLSAEGLKIVSKWPHFADALQGLERSKVRSTGPTAAAAPPTFLISPVSTSFLVMMSSAAVYCSSIAASSAPVQEQPNPAIDWHLLDSQMIRQGMERLTPHKASSRSSDTNPYIHLIRAYLRALVPQAQSHDDNHISKAVGMLSAQVVTAFLDMWLTDLDMLTPTTAAKQPSASRGSPLSRSQSPTPHDPPPTSARVPTFSTPTILHSSSIKELVRHIYVAWEPSKPSTTKRHMPSPQLTPQLTTQPHRTTQKAPPKPAQANNAWLPREIVLMAYSVSNYPLTAPISGTSSRQLLSYHLGPAASAPVQQVACCVYRFLRRAVVMWPVGQAHDQLDAVIDVWAGVLFPWTLTDPRAKYSSVWADHVLAHLPFYLVLFPLFLDLVTQNAAFAAQQAAKHLKRAAKSFAREKELCKFLKDLEHANRCLRSHKPIPSACSDHTSHSLDVLLPLISQQAVLLEQAATAGAGHAAAKRERAAEEAADFRLFADESCSLTGATSKRTHVSGAEKAADVLQLLQGNITRDAYRSLCENLHFLGWERFHAGGSHPGHSLSFTPDVRTMLWGGPDSVLRSTVPYNGEYLMRPVGRNEVPFLVEPLANTSIWLNEWLGFTNDKQLESSHPAVQKTVRHLKRRGYYVDLRRLFEHQSIAFLTITSSAIYYLALQVATRGVALMTVVVCHALVFSYCTMW